MESSKKLMFGKVITGRTTNGKPKTAIAYFDFNDVLQISFSPYAEKDFQYGALINVRGNGRKNQVVYFSKGKYKYLQEKFWEII